MGWVEKEKSTQSVKHLSWMDGWQLGWSDCNLAQCWEELLHTWRSEEFKDCLMIFLIPRSHRQSDEGGFEVVAAGDTWVGSESEVRCTHWTGCDLGTLQGSTNSGWENMASGRG